MAPYDTAADIYANSGLWPIPVAGKNPPVRGTTGYKGTVTFEKLVDWTSPDLRIRAKAGRGVGMDNVALRHRLTLAIDVDYGYGGKDGVTALAAFAAEHNLPPLAATWSSTARGDDSPSRQYLYSIPTDVTMKTKPCPHVELCNWHHRYTVCAPSMHDSGNAYAWYQPGTPGVPPGWGSRTDRYPRADELTMLHPAWFEAFRGAVANADEGIPVVALPALLATMPSGQPDKLVDFLIAKWADPARHVGHDEFKQAAVHAILLGREGHPGVGQLLQTLLTRLIGYLQTARPGEAEREARDLLGAASIIGQQKPLNGGQQVTTGDVQTFLCTFTAYGDPARLGRRIAWMKTEPADRLPFHGRHLIRDAVLGHYPADQAVRALLDAYRHHGADDAAAFSTLTLALGAILNAKVSA